MTLQKIKRSAELTRDGINNIKSSVYKIVEMHAHGETNTLDRWIMADNLDRKLSDNGKKNQLPEHYEMSRRLDWDVFRKIYDIQPRNYEQLISIPGVGPASVRALSLIGELIYGTKTSWKDPVKYNFAHGGKDGVPYPVARKTYDKSISYLFSAIEGAEIEREERIQALRKLAEYSAGMFN